ncbi:adenosylhomocysteinase [Wukongibacter baidiensis]|uniref:adenosylhomocysteinase n=1 Tax=Wukongibacter baidiensis TaxID=1723361 RepID=UPI003D7FCA00
MKSIIDDINLSESGKDRIEWFRAQMPILRSLEETFVKEQTFKGTTLAICMHVEPKTAFWIEGLLKGGAEHIYLVGCLGTTKKDTAAYLATLDKVIVLAKENDTLEDHKKYLKEVMKHKCDLFLDNGGSLTLAYYEAKPNWKPLGANEETRSGKLLIEDAKLDIDFPIIVIDDSPLKKMLENAIGVGQSVVDGFMRCTSLLLGGKKVLVIGYGWCGSGVATKFKGMGATTMVYDIDPLYSLKAKAEGHFVGELEELIPMADVIITVTGRFDVIRPEHVALIKDGVILANSGHYGFEIDVQGLKEASSEVLDVKKGITKLTVDSKTLYILENASPINLSAGDGNPIEIMDLGLGLQSASAAKIINNHDTLVNGMQTVPDDINQAISEISLKSI